VLGVVAGADVAVAAGRRVVAGVDAVVVDVVVVVVADVAAVAVVAGLVGVVAEEIVGERLGCT
jgi:hypothetical protein